MMDRDDIKIKRGHYHGSRILNIITMTTSALNAYAKEGNYNIVIEHRRV